MNKKNERRKLKECLSEMVQKHGIVFWESLSSCVEYFGHCHCGRRPVLLNVHKGNYMYCRPCNTYWHVGTNLITTWRDEDESVWKKNSAILDTAKRIESKHPYICPFGGPSGLMYPEEIRQSIELDCENCSERQEKEKRETSLNQEDRFASKIPF